MDGVIWRVLLALAIILASAKVATGEPPRRADFDKVFSQTRSTLSLPSLSAAVALGERIVYSNTFGWADVSRKIPARKETAYRLGALGEPIIAAAMMQQIRRGRLTLDEPISNRLRDFPEKPEGTISLRRLLAHASGFRDARPRESHSLELSASPRDVARTYENEALEFEPGTKNLPSSLGYNLVAAVLDDTTDRTYEAYIERNVFRTSGMYDSGFERPESTVEHVARFYVRNGDNSLATAPSNDRTIAWSTGRMLASAEDLVKFHLALQSCRLLPADSLGELERPFTLPDGAPSPYSLGWHVRQDFEHGPMLTRSSESAGASAVMIRVPAKQFAIVLLTNVEGVRELTRLAEGLTKNLLGETE